MQRFLNSVAITAVLVGSLTIAGAPRAQAQPSSMPTRITQLLTRNQIDTYLKTAQFHGYMLLINAYGRVLLSKGYGMADVAHKVPFTIQTPYPAFGVEGFMIAMATLKLQEQGKLKVTHRLCMYIAGCPSEWQPITLHMLLTGTSGIGNYNPVTDSGSTSIKDTIATCQQLPLAATPGALSEDSPCNRVLLSAIVTKASGQPFTTFMQKLIFDPASLTHTHFATGAVAPPHSAAGYNAGVPAPTLNMAGYPLIYTTADDIARLDRAVLAGKIISPKSLHSLFTPYINDNPPYKDGPYRSYGTFADNIASFTDSGPRGSGFLIDNSFSLHNGAMAIWLINDSSLFGEDAENTFGPKLATAVPISTGV